MQTNGEKQSKMIVDYMTSDLKYSFSDLTIVSDFAGIGRFVTGFRLWDRGAISQYHVLIEQQKGEQSICHVITIAWLFCVTLNLYDYIPRMWEKKKRFGSREDLQQQNKRRSK